LFTHFRIILNYKRIPFTTVWIEYADVGNTVAALGAPPSAHYPDGSPRYTVPTIYDPNTGRLVTDSVEIAKYLDEQYPERLVFPNGMADQQAAFAQSITPTLAKVKSSAPELVYYD
jgi:glutathione S-transferase